MLTVDKETSRKLLEEYSRNWQNLIDMLPYPVSIHDTEYNVVMANKGFIDVCGRTDVAGMKCYKLIHCKDQPVETCPMTKTLKTGNPESSEIYEPILKKHLLVKTSPIFVENDLIGLKENEIRNLRLAGLLHDIGKIGTYDYLLNEPAKLSDDEFSIIKKHPAKGAGILKEIKQLKDVIPFIRHHHERIDGRGYPDGLKGEDIPLGARILHAADSFDAMTAGRPYMPAPGIEYAISELKKHAGSQFDPQVVDVFIRVLKREKNVD